MARVYYELARSGTFSANVKTIVSTNPIRVRLVCK